MKPISNSDSAAVERILTDSGVVRILRRAAKRFGIDWEDLRQTLALRLLQRDMGVTVLPVRLDVLHTEIKSIAIDLHRREPQGKLDRLGERRRRERQNSECEPFANNRTICMLPEFDQEDQRRSMDELLARLSIEEAIDRVPPESRWVFELRLRDEMSFPEIAKQTGKELEQIKSQWRSHTPKIRELFKKELM